jgi:drug/metabolite transporter (DMT)-like permease
LGEWLGVAIAIVSSSLGGTTAAVTRYLVGGADPLTLAILRWGIGFLCVLPVAVLLRVAWPKRSDWPAVAALGVCFFGAFFILYNIAVGYTTAARASLALSTLPLQTMLVGALLGAELLTWRKSAGVAIAMLGVLAALASGVMAAPPGAWRGELIMTRGGPLRGGLQCVVASLHAAFECAGFPGGWDAMRCGGAHPRWSRHE